MKKLEGKTVEEVLATFAKENNVEVSEIVYNIIEEKKGLLGLGNKVVIEAYCEKDIEEFIYSYLDTFFKGIEKDVEITVTKEDELYKVMLNGENNAILIGKNGQTLQSLNTILKSALSSTFKKRIAVLIDINNYKEERYEKVKSMALRIAKTVQRTKVEAVLDPLPNDERKMVHQALTGIPNIKTESVGEGRDRRLHIKYVD